MPNLGSVQVEMKRLSLSKGLCLLVYFGVVEDFRAERVVKLWPVGGTNCLAASESISDEIFLGRFLFGGTNGHHISGSL